MVIPVLNSIREEISGKTAALKKDVYQEEQAMVVTMYCVMNRTMDLMRQEWTSNKVKRKVVENTAFDAG
jgi:hypothetical protein